MDPNTNSQNPGFELPKPMKAPAETGNPAATSEKNQAPLGIEKPIVEQVPSGSPMVSPAPSSTPAPAITGATAQYLTQTQPPAQASMPQIADDVDLIEKEWVHKAKAIVEQTRDNPHLQNKELTKVKADYIKKRYNKEIKVSED